MNHFDVKKVFILFVLGILLSIVPSTLWSKNQDNVVKITDLTSGLETDIGSFSVFATNSIYLHSRTQVLSGNVGVLYGGSIPIPTLLGVDAQVTVGTHSYMHDGVSIYGNRVFIKSTGSACDVYCNFFGGKGEVRDIIYSPLPNLNIILPYFPYPFPGLQDITMAPNGFYVLDSGNYGEVWLKPNSTLIFTGGIYNLQNLNIAPNCLIRFQAPTVVIINNRLETDPHVEFGPEVDTNISAKDIVFYVNGTSENSGRNDVPRKAAVTIGTKNIIKANFYAPNGTIWLRNDVDAEGAFIGKDVLIGPKSTINHNSAFDSGSTPR